jgi:hypothetical protein
MGSRWAEGLVQYSGAAAEEEVSAGEIMAVTQCNSIYIDI